MNTRTITSLALIGIIAIASYFFLRSQEDQADSTPSAPETPKKPNASIPTTPSQPQSLVDRVPRANGILAPDNSDSRISRFTNGVVHMNDPITRSKTLGAEGRSAEDDIGVIDQIFTSYRLVFKENPVGTENREFTTALLGRNPKSVVFIDPDSARIKEGELLDEWGNPYYFHPVSAEKIEIRSRGADGQLWTEDDVFPYGQQDDLVPR